MSEEYSPDILTLTDDQENEYSFEILDELEDDGFRYLALLPVYDDPQEFVESPGELVILKEFEEDGEFSYEEIENDDEYDTISDAFLARLQDVFEIE